MAEQQTNLMTSTGASPRSVMRPMLEGLRERLLPRGDNLTLLVAYAIVLTALLTFMLMARALPAWRYYGTILLLSALLALNVSPFRHIPLSDRQTVRGWAYLLVAGALFLLAFSLSSGPYTSFIPHILFLLVGQSIWLLPLRYALVYTAGLLGGMSLIMWNVAGLTNTLESVPSFHYRTEHMSALCGSIHRLTDGLLGQNRRDEETRWQGDIVLEAARQ